MYTIESRDFDLECRYFEGTRLAPVLGLRGAVDFRPFCGIVPSLSGISRCFNIVGASAIDIQLGGRKTTIARRLATWNTTMCVNVSG
jgi:hypothetical protein